MRPSKVVYLISLLLFPFLAPLLSPNPKPFFPPTLDDHNLLKKPGSTLSSHLQRSTNQTSLMKIIARELLLFLQQVISGDAWKLSILTILYVLQNNLQFIAASDLEVATFSVPYQLKPLAWVWFNFNTYDLPVLLLKTYAPPIDSSVSSPSPPPVSLRLSLFSLLPALFTTLYYLIGLFHKFGLAACLMILIQVIGGLVKALVIKFPDNILKGSATLFLIILSTLAEVILFKDPLPLGSALGASVVLMSTSAYKQSSSSEKREGTRTLPIRTPLRILSCKKDQMGRNKEM
ncbi:hypothetical protein DFH28DRAFT_1121860 [Melampsora americana]|nr:hypothetical protein DFH28DRAFT_1121860 [Melampsora americana]